METQTYEVRFWKVNNPCTKNQVRAVLLALFIRHVKEAFLLPFTCWVRAAILTFFNRCIKNLLPHILACMLTEILLGPYNRTWKSTITRFFFLFAYDILIDIGLFPFFEGNMQTIGCQIEKK